MINETCEKAISAIINNSTNLDALNITELSQACPGIINGAMSGGVAGFFGGVLGGFVAFVLLTFFLALFAIQYVYFALAWQSIAKKVNYKRPWLAWIPFAKTSMILQLGGFHWAWVFLYLIPIFGWIVLAAMIIISTWDIFEKRKYAGWWILIAVLFAVLFDYGMIFYAVLIGIIAWRDKKVVEVKKVVKKKKKKQKSIK